MRKLAAAFVLVCASVTHLQVLAEEANHCVNKIVLGRDPVCPNSGRSAGVTNLCRQKIDVRLCMQNPERWDCRVEWGVDPGDSWSNSWCRGNGRWFFDARFTGSRERLQSPD